MAGKEIKQKISIDADTQPLDELTAKEQRLADATGDAGREAEGATRKMDRNKTATEDLGKKAERSARDEGRLADQTERAGRAADKASGSMSIKQRAIQGAAGAVRSMVAQWLAFAAIAGTVITLFRDIASAAREATQAAVELGGAVRGLTANVGAQRAGDLLGGINEIAAESRFDPKGRTELINAVTSLTDLRPGLTDKAILGTARNLALLQRGTGVSGSQGTRVLISLSENLGLSEDQAVDFGVTALNSGLDAEALAQIAERGGNAGGKDLVALLLAARGTGLDVNRAGRSIPAVINSLTRTDDSGALAEDLQRVGLTEDMSLVERIQAVIEARRSGRINEGQFNRAIGGGQNQRFFGPFERALQRNLLQSAQQALLDPEAAERTIEELTKNEFIKAQERQNVRELSRLIRQENSALTPLGEELSDFEARHRDTPLLIRGLSFVGNLPNLVLPGDPEEFAEQNVRDIQALQDTGGGVGVGGATPGGTVGGGSGGVVVNYNDNRQVVTNQYNNGPPPQQQVVRPEEQ